MNKAKNNVVPLRQPKVLTPSLGTMPTVEDLRRIPLARHAEYELSDRECRIVRSRLYAINKDGIRRYRTMRDAPYLIIWRIK